MTSTRTCRASHGETSDATPTTPDAYAYIQDNATIRTGGANIDTIVYNNVLNRYEITFTDLSFSINDDIALVSSAVQGYNASANSVGGNTLLVHVTDDTGAPAQQSFTFMIWDSVE